MPIHVHGVLVRAMSGIELSRVRTELEPLRRTSYFRFDRHTLENIHSSKVVSRMADVNVPNMA